jgi:hypothetical protein
MALYSGSLVTERVLASEFGLKKFLRLGINLPLAVLLVERFTPE